MADLPDSCQQLFAFLLELHLLKFSNEKMILEKAYNEYLDLKKKNLWGSRKYF